MGSGMEGSDTKPVMSPTSLCRSDMSSALRRMKKAVSRLVAAAARLISASMFSSLPMVPSAPAKAVMSVGV